MKCKPRGNFKYFMHAVIIFSRAFDIHESIDLLAKLDALRNEVLGIALKQNHR